MTKLYKAEGKRILIGKYYYVPENSVIKLLTDIYNMLLLGFYKDAKRTIEKIISKNLIDNLK